MAGNVTGLHRFADDTGPIPLSLLDTNYDALTVAMNTLSTFSNFYLDTGSTNALTVTTPPTQFVSYVDGLTLLVRVANTVTGAATLNVNNLGPRPILRSASGALAPNDILAGETVQFVFNASDPSWVVPKLGGGGGGGGGGSGSPFTAPFQVMANTTSSGGAVTTNPVINIPATFTDTVGMHMLSPVFIGPGSDVATGIPLTIGGQQNYDTLWVDASTHTQPGWYTARFYADTSVGMSNGVMIAAGTNASDNCILAGNHNPADTGLPPTTFFQIRGDGSGSLGPAPNQLTWNAGGAFTLTGGATLPGGGGGSSTLSGLADVTISGPVSGQVLMWNGTAWVNSIAPGGGGGGGFPGIQHSPATISPGSGVTLTLNGAVDSDVLDIFGATNTVPSQWLAALHYTPAPPTLGMSNGLLIQAGTNASDKAIMIETATGTTQYLQVNGDGSGFIGPSNANNLSWTATGTFTIGGNPLAAAAALGIAPLAIATQTTSVITRPTAPSTANAWLQDIGGRSAGITTPTATGLSNGLLVSGGTNASDQALLVQNAAGTSNYLQVYGDGHGKIGAGQTITWNAAGTPTFTSLNQSTPAANWVTQPRTLPNLFLWEIGGGGPSGSSAGCSNGLYIASGTNASDYPLYIKNDAENATLFALAGDGSGTLGVAQWSNAGIYTFGPTTQNGPAPLVIRQYPLTVPNMWMFQIGGGTSGASAGCSNGLYIGAGTNTNDMALWVQSDDATEDFLIVKGDGSVYAPSLPTISGVTANLYVDADGKLWKVT